MKENRTKTIGVRVTEEEAKIFKLIAETNGITISELMRKACFYYSRIRAEHLDSVEQTGLDTQEGEQFLHDLVENGNEALCSTLRSCESSISDDIGRLRELIITLFYTYLVHTQELPADVEAAGLASAAPRLRKFRAAVRREKNLEKRERGG